MNAATPSGVQVADFKRRASSDAELARAKARLQHSATLLRDLPWKVVIELGGKERHYIDCRAGLMTAADEDEKHAPDCVISLSAADFLQVATAAIDARTLLFYQRAKVTGSPKIATKFLDAIGGRRLVNALASDRPLPSPTTDLDLAKAQLREFGYCFIKDPLSPLQLAALTRRLEDQAAAEREIGYSSRGTGTKTGIPPIQPVWNLVNKGQVFVDLLEHPLVDEFCIEFLGEYFLISSFTSKIAHPGCQPQLMHNDQIGIHPPMPQINVGLNIFFFLDDFTEANGATRLLPGSHLPENAVGLDNIFSTDGTIAAAAPAGTALIFDTRLWHGTGANKTDRDRRAVFMLFTRSWMRTVENHTLSVRPEVLARMPERLKIMHGFRTTSSAGGVDGAIEGEIVDRDFAKRLGDLHSSNPA